LLGQANLRRGTINLYGDVGGVFYLPAARAYVAAGTPPTYTDLVTRDSGEPSVQPSYGGGGAVAISRLFWVYGEYGYIAKDQEIATIPNEVTVNNNSHYSHWESGIQFSYPTVHRVAPYLLAGGGMLHESYSESSFVSPSLGNPGVSAGYISRNHGLVHFGGGVRFFLGNHWGVRAGVDGFYMPQAVQETLPVVNVAFAIPVEARHGFEEVSGGVFFQFR